MARRPNRRRNRPDTMYQDINQPDAGFQNRILPYNPGVDNTTMMPGGKPNVDLVGGFSPEDVVTADFGNQFASQALGDYTSQFGSQPQMPGGRPNYRTQGPDNMPGRISIADSGYYGGQPAMGMRRTMDLRPGDKGYDPAILEEYNNRQIDPRTQRRMDRFARATQQLSPASEAPQAPQAPQGVDLYGNPLGPVQPQMDQGPLRNLRQQGPNNMPGMPRTQGPDNMPGMQPQMPYQQMPYQQSPYQMYGGFGGPQMGYGQQSFNPMFGGIAAMPMQFSGGFGGGQPMMGGRGKGGGGQSSPFGQPMMGGRGKGGGGSNMYGGSFF